MIPPNVWIGVSVPPTETAAGVLTEHQQLRMWETALQSVTQIDVPIRFVSMEPLSMTDEQTLLDGQPFASAMLDVLDTYAVGLQWAIIGAASAGRHYIQPDINILHRTRHILANKHGIPVWFKNNLEPELVTAGGNLWYAYHPNEGIGHNLGRILHWDNRALKSAIQEHNLFL